MNDLVFSRRRIYRLFAPDGRSLVVALDHGSGLNVYPALADPARIIEAVLAGGADAVLTTPGIIRQYRHQLKGVGVIMRCDGGSSPLEGGSMSYQLLYTVEDALRLGADAVACMGFPGSPIESETLTNLARLAAQCQAWDMPLMAEMLPGGFTNFEHHTAENIRLAARIGVELGADIIKTEYAGPVEKYREVVENCYRPILVLGGGKTEDERGVLEMVRNALDAGARGIVMGRNIWAHHRPQAMVRALHALIHADASVEESLGVLAAEETRPG